jgi:hypothetical protein
MKGRAKETKMKLPPAHCGLSEPLRFGGSLE